MTLPSRGQWQKFRDTHKDSPGKGAVASVNIGKTLDEVQKFSGDKNFKKVAAGYQKTVKSFKLYHSKVQKKHPSFAADFKKQYIDEAESSLKSAQAIASPAKALKENITKIASLVGAMNPSSSHADYDKLHTSDPVRLIAMNLGMIVKNDAKKSAAVTPILNAWKASMNQILPAKVADTPDAIGKAVVTLRKAVQKLAGDCKAAGVI